MRLTFAGNGKRQEKRERQGEQETIPPGKRRSAPLSDPMVIFSMKISSLCFSAQWDTLCFLLNT